MGLSMGYSFNSSVSYHTRPDHCFDAFAPLPVPTIGFIIRVSLNRLAATQRLAYFYALRCSVSPQPAPGNSVRLPFQLDDPCPKVGDGNRTQVHRPTRLLKTAYHCQ